MRKTDYFNNSGGLNLADSPLFIRPEQAAGGYNFDLSKTGGITKIRGYTKLNSSADTQLKSLLLDVALSKTGTSTVIRGAGTKLQTFNVTNGTFTNLTDDTSSAGTDFLSSSSTQPVSSVNFNTADANLMWLAGGGMSSIYGYNGSKITANGVAAPTGTFTTSVGGSSGSWTSTGTYYYALVLRKASTQALSNAALDESATISNATDQVTLTFPTGIDTTKYDKWYVYRSAVSGAESFTTGTLVAQVATTEATYVDNGNVSVATSQNVPRSGSTVLDNSPLESGTYKYVTAFKRRLVAAKNNTVYVSDLDKPESWPIDINVSLPYGGDITGIGVVGFNAPITGNTDEYLVVFQKEYCWVITGDFSYDSDLGIYNFELKFLDAVGCANQSLVVSTNGFITWIDSRGVYMWNGSGKPIYVSKNISSLFGLDGDLDKSKLGIGWGRYVRQKDQIIWCLSHRTKGENKVRLKLDLKLTAAKIQQGLENTVVEGVFMLDTDIALYAGAIYNPSSNAEYFLAGDASGFIYRLYFATSNDSGDINFNYETPFLDQNAPSVAKQYYKVIAFVDESINKDLTLEYWSDYRLLAVEKSQISETMQLKSEVRSSLWDLAVWDESNWDESSSKIKQVVFNLHSNENNNQGDCLKLNFVQNDADAPVTIYGFSILWDEISARK